MEAVAHGVVRAVGLARRGPPWLALAAVLAALAPRVSDGGSGDARVGRIEVFEWRRSAELAAGLAESEPWREIRASYEWPAGRAARIELRYSVLARTERQGLVVLEGRQSAVWESGQVGECRGRMFLGPRTRECCRGWRTEWRRKPRGTERRSGGVSRWTTAPGRSGRRWN